MKCFSARRLLIRETAGDLPEPLSRELAAHLQSCDSCAAELQELRHACAMFAGARPPAVEPRADFADRIQQKILDERAASARPAPRMAASWRLGTAAAAVMLAVVGYTAIVQYSPTEENYHPIASYGPGKAQTGSRTGASEKGVTGSLKAPASPAETSTPEPSAARSAASGAAVTPGASRVEDEPRVTGPSIVLGRETGPGGADAGAMSVNSADAFGTDRRSRSGAAASVADSTAVGFRSRIAAGANKPSSTASMYTPPVEERLGRGIDKADGTDIRDAAKDAPATNLYAYGLGRVTDWYYSDSDGRWKLGERVAGDLVARAGAGGVRFTGGVVDRLEGSTMGLSFNGFEGPGGGASMPASASPAPLMCMATSAVESARALEMVYTSADAKAKAIFDY